MSLFTHYQTTLERLLFQSAEWMSVTTPVASRIFRERLEIDDNISFWVSQAAEYQPNSPLSQPIHADLAIIGGGFTGVSMAYHFSRRYPNKRVVLLEAKTLANGASGRNGGMMLNWVTGITDDSPLMTHRIYNATQKGIQMVLEIIKRHDLAVDYRMDGTMTVHTNAQRAEAAHRAAEYQNSLGIPDRFVDRQSLRQYMEIEGVYGATFEPDTGQINGVQLVQGLRPVLENQGVEIYEHTPVLKVQEGSTITLTTPHAEIQAQAIVLATNGYTGKLGYFKKAFFPLHSHVFATAPVPEEKRSLFGVNQFAGYADDLDRIAYSTMTRDGHIIFGGGSNQSYAYLFNNRTAYPGSPTSSFKRIKQTFYDYFPAGKTLPIEHYWTGTLGITMNRTPLMGVRGEHRNVYYALGYCGHGVTLANLAGQVLTDCYSGDDEPWRGLPFYQNEYVSIPPEPFRWFGYQMFTKLTGNSPRV